MNFARFSLLNCRGSWSWNSRARSALTHWSPLRFLSPGSQSHFYQAISTHFRASRLLYANPCPRCSWRSASIDWNDIEQHHAVKTRLIAAISPCWVIWFCTSKHNLLLNKLKIQNQPLFQLSFPSYHKTKQSVLPSINIDRSLLIIFQILKPPSNRIQRYAWH